jgi:hypothetical protein
MGVLSTKRRLKTGQQDAILPHKVSDAYRTIYFTQIGLDQARFLSTWVTRT